MNRIITALLCALAVVFVFRSADARQLDVQPEIQKALEGGDTAKAIQLLNAQVELDPSFFANYSLLGEIYFNREDYARARAQFAKAIDYKGKDWPSLLMLGRSLLKLGELDSAESVMDSGRKRAKEVAHMFENGFGFVMMARKNYLEADRSFRKALVDQPKNVEYRINLGDANFFQGVPSLAISEYEQAIKDDQGALEVYYHWAEACLEMKDYNCALEKLRIVLEKDSTHAAAWMRAGAIYFKAALSSRDRTERLGRFKATIDAYQRAIALSGSGADSSTVRPYYEIGLAYLQIYEFDSAQSRFEQVLAIPYEPRDIYFNLGKAYWGNKNYEKSGEMLQKHLEIQSQPDPPPTSVAESELNQIMGDNFFYRKPADFAQAVEWYRKAFEKDTTQKRLVYNIAIAYHQLKSYRQALEFYDRRIALGVDSTIFPLYRNAGYCALNLADDPPEEGGDEEADVAPVNYHEQAIGYFDRFLESSPADTGVLLLAGNTALYQLKDCSRSVKYFTDLLGASPNNCAAKKSLGFAYFGGVCDKNYDRSIKYLTEAFSCGGQMQKDADLALWIAQAYHLRAASKTGENGGASSDFKNAYDWYEKVLALQPNNADAKKGRDDTRFEF